MSLQYPDSHVFYRKQSDIGTMVELLMRAAERTVPASEAHR